MLPPLPHNKIDTPVDFLAPGTCIFPGSKIFFKRAFEVSPEHDLIVPKYRSTSRRISSSISPDAHTGMVDPVPLFRLDFLYGRRLSKYPLRLLFLKFPENVRFEAGKTGFCTTPDPSGSSERRRTSSGNDDPRQSRRPSRGYVKQEPIALRRFFVETLPASDSRIEVRPGNLVKVYDVPGTDGTRECHGEFQRSFREGQENLKEVLHMSMESAVAFYERVERETELRQKLKEFDTKENVAQFVKGELGYDFTLEEMQKVIFERNPKITDEEMEAVVGGSEVDFLSGYLAGMGVTVGIFVGGALGGVGIVGAAAAAAA